MIFVVNILIYIVGIECDGSLTLLAEIPSNKTISWEIRPTNFGRRKRKKIKRFHKDTNKLVRFEKATLKGNCCWRIWNRYRLGEYNLLSRSDTFEPGWRIAAVELMENCSLD